MPAEKQLYLSVSQKDHAYLNELAADAGITVGQWLRKAVDRKLQADCLPILEPLRKYPRPVKRVAGCQ